MNIFWLLCGNHKNPSSRIHGINLHKYLKTRGFSTFLVHLPNYYTQDIIWNYFFTPLLLKNIRSQDIVIIQKLEGPKTIQFLKGVKDKGAQIILIDCDLPLKLNIARFADCIICPSISLANLYRESGNLNVHVIHDAVEFYKKPVLKHSISKKLIWFGKSGQGKWEWISDFNCKVLPVIGSNWNLFRLSDHQDAEFKWDLVSFPEIISNHDLSIIPIDHKEENLVKSANRCTQSMALGVPVLANRLDSYSEIIVNNRNGFISDDWKDWKEFLIKCEDMTFLNSLKQQAYSDSLNFSIPKISDRWIDLLGLKKAKKSFFGRVYSKILFDFLFRWFATSRFLNAK